SRRNRRRATTSPRLRGTSERPRVPKPRKRSSRKRRPPRSAATGGAFRSSAAKSAAAAVFVPPAERAGSLHAQHAGRQEIAEVRRELGAGVARRGVIAAVFGREPAHHRVDVLSPIR